ncbi:hypothetical protein A2631_01305 [Candidatus Daviesbacteria bacterium RIFCSPHIGHO2_01_FULL_44_29]|uniref:Superoxide dismutase copper/zinc binding domain-containing protein n=1 Tax=Candidatus Daviesbacteria bacterium RIFCSPHIGHO2_02_FULL_43_12 TaxID=1797776 RepID=A0A1F5KL24_9BACT|nr:MAG: hypothetical protein A2631_01305 [Candidatus Daviesbacteria bacterium RIFCSPHIGHO2_01_FULL_44_29]OGE39671.1 MAG: hypothetical protein A3E86_00005 [Candidatus Daviesbacteria bacterium RIFCSPHIGHO2_12_FULL_47_45]OGE41529.1 MAG: hypothetical protein A3D25_00725 [Candidatus Daviesbacteria bacterium RIFCSPHIGHO2_02_FULL_43_12]OGE69811.1 MAG: hypothetical protein A3B55_05370 [Candidatus Daviesbacteria bacterium RIFCSPLOWO2_01_FULL_43_15]
MFDFSDWTKTAQAKADFVSEQGVSGQANFTEYQKDTVTLVHVTVDVQGDPAVLTPGLHGCHIHETGLAEPPFASAKGHFDPGPSGNSDPDVNHPFHAGDLPNIQVNNDGVGHLETITSRITLTDGPLTIFDADGASVVLHSHTDHCEPAESKSGHSGGPRLACGVIEQI